MQHVCNVTTSSHRNRLTFAPRSLVVAGGLPGAGKTTHALVALPTTASFPCGHATTAAAAATALALLVPRWRVPAAAIALLVGASRVLLGVHFVADVLAGFALGAAIGVLVALAVRRRLGGGRHRAHDVVAPG